MAAQHQLRPSAERKGQKPSTVDMSPASVNARTQVLLSPRTGTALHAAAPTVHTHFSAAHPQDGRQPTNH